jgi:hypothetical protein
MSGSGDFIVRTVSGVPIEQRYRDGYINATKLSNAHRITTGQRREPAEWLSNQRTRETIDHLSRSTGIPVDLLVVVVSTGPNQARGTYIHPNLSVRYAIWLSDEFGFLVEQWVQEWLSSGRSPLADIDRVGLRDALKDDSRLRMTDQVKAYLEQIKRYDDKNYRGWFFSRVHDAINVAITGETAREMRRRLSTILGKPITQDDLIRDYFPSEVLQRYISMCEASANLMIKQGRQPLTAVEEAAELVLPLGYRPTPIDFVEYIGRVRRRLAGQDLELPGF